MRLMFHNERFSHYLSSDFQMLRRAYQDLRLHFNLHYCIDPVFYRAHFMSGLDKLNILGLHK